MSTEKNENNAPPCNHSINKNNRSHSLPIQYLIDSFNIQPQGISKEIVGGLTTFFTMAYIVIVNPSILSTEGTGMPFQGVMTATVLLSFSMTLLMGIYAKLPFAVAPGMGLNAFFTFSIILNNRVPWQEALGIVFWAGIFFILISLTSLREHIANSIPKNLRSASATGIGLFLTFIGLKNMGLVVADPATFVKMGPITPALALSIAGLFLMATLMMRKHPLAFLVGISSITLGALAMGLISAPSHFVSWPDFHSVLFKADFFQALKLKNLPSLMSILFTDFFDSISTFIGVSMATGLLNQNGHPLRLKQGLVVDAFATMSAGLFGTSSGTAFIESAAGIEAGGRTRLSAIVTAFCFLPCLFLSPLAALVPAYATAPVLVLVGALMFRTVGELSFHKLEDAIPAFLTIVLIPLTFSITQGILWGFVSHSLLHVFSGKRKELNRTMIAISVLSAILLVLEHI